MPSIDDKLARLEAEILQIRRGGSRNRQKPHKLFMLLAVIDLADQGLFTENRIFFSDALIHNFEKHFRNFAKADDWCQPGPPFFHLRTASFWKHQIKPGRDQAYSKLTTSGGGTKRIKDNIDYAYLDEDAFEVVQNQSLRNPLRIFLVQQLQDILIDNPDMNPTNRLATSFHESFSLSRPAIQQVLRAISLGVDDQNLKSQGIRHELLRSETLLGNNYVKSMPKYATGSGLLDFDYKITQFGKFAYQNDPLLIQIGTQWLMHYHLSAPHGPGPAFWHDLVSTRFRSGDEFSSDEIAQQIAGFYERSEGRPLVERTARSTATIFLETYTKSDGLANLGLLQECNNQRYRVLEPDTPPLWVIALALQDLWQARYQGLVSISLNELYGERGVNNLFLIGRGRLNSLLETLQDEGIVELYRVAPPYQVLLLLRDDEPLLRRLYGAEISD